MLASSTLKTLGSCFVLAGLALGLIQPLAIFLVTERLALPKEYLQWLMMASGIAMMIGGGATVAVSKKAAAPAFAFARHGRKRRRDFPLRVVYPAVAHARRECD
ncbi:hypothetical protein LJK87_21250 [Paenibacillus sp. P25]|nr:hypothetical protein LJK87_21250 [Paenibacillus sp. P25]